MKACRGIIAIALAACLLTLLSCNENKSANPLLTTTFMKTYDFGNSARIVVVKGTSDGGYILGGTAIDQTGNERPYLIKTTALGDTTWTASVGDVTYTMRSLSIAHDGGFYLAGYAGGTGQSYIQKVNNSGELLWTKDCSSNSLWGDLAAEVRTTLDGGCIAVGYSYNTFYRDWSRDYVVRLDRNGDIVWTNRFADGGRRQGSSVVQNIDGSFLVFGTINKSTGATEAYLSSVSSDGDLIWSKTYAVDAYTSGLCGTRSFDDGFIISGSCVDSVGSVDLFLVKTDSIGNLIWMRDYDDAAEYTAGYSCIPTDDGGFAVTGPTRLDGSYSFDIQITKVSANGDPVWSKTIGEPSDNEVAYSISRAHNGGYAVAGHTEIYQGVESFLIIIAPDGTLNR